MDFALNPLDAPDNLTAWRWYSQMSRDLVPPAHRHVFLPRRYVPPQAFLNPSTFGFFLYAEMQAALGRDGNLIDSILSVVSVQLCNQGFPTYFVAPKFAEAVSQTNPPQEGTVGEVHWPLEAALFCLPLETSVRLFGVPVPFVAFSRCSGGHIQSRFNCPPRKFELSGDLVATFYPVLEGRLPIFYHRHAPPTLELKRFLHMEKPITLGLGLDKVQEYTGEKFDPVEERSFLDRINAFVIKLVFAMAARPQYLERESVQRPAKVKKGVVVRDELWNPNVLGRNYQVAEPAEGGSHASPRIHWRRGHFHTVSHGKGRLLKRLDWFEPVMVGVNAPA